MSNPYLNWDQERGHEDPFGPGRDSRRRVELSPEEQTAKAKAAKEKTQCQETLEGVMYISPQRKGGT
jgi:hypothetical protein